MSDPLGLTLTSAEITTSSATALYTAPSNTHVVIKNAYICETTNAAIALNLWVVKTGGSVDDGGKLYNDTNVAAKTTVALSALINYVLNPGDAVHATGDTGSALTLHLSGSVI